MPTNAIAQARKRASNDNEVLLDMNGQQVVDRIGFAERWLDRAKRQCEGGDVSRGMLTLVLANAEMTHALRLAHTAKPIRPRWIWGAAFAAACSLALGALAGWQLGGGVPVSGAEGPIIVTLNHEPGALLRLIQADPNRTSATLTVHSFPNISVQRQRSTAAPLRRRLSGSPRSLPSVPQAHASYGRSVSYPQTAAQPAQIVSQVTSAPPTQTVESAVPSDVDLINLVLTAERTLRIQSRP